MKQKIIDSVEKVTGVTFDEIRSKKKDRDIVEARQLLCYVLHKEGLTYKEVGDIVNVNTSSAYYSFMSISQKGNQKLSMLSKYL